MLFSHHVDRPERKPFRRPALSVSYAQGKSGEAGRSDSGHQRRITAEDYGVAGGHGRAGKGQQGQEVAVTANKGEQKLHKPLILPCLKSWDPVT
jgi:hypothetical protein